MRIVIFSLQTYGKILQCTLLPVNESKHQIISELWQIIWSAMTYVPFTDRATGKGHLRSCEVINSCWSINRDVIAPKTCKWYQSVCLVMLRWLVSSRTFLGQILKLNYHGYQVSFYFYDIWWPQYWPDPQRLFTKVGVLSTNYQTSLTVFRFPSFFFFNVWRRGKEGPPPDSKPFRARQE